MQVLKQLSLKCLAQEHSRIQTADASLTPTTKRGGKTIVNLHLFSPNRSTGRLRLHVCLASRNEEVDPMGRHNLHAVSRE